MNAGVFVDPADKLPPIPEHEPIPIAKMMVKAGREGVLQAIFVGRSSFGWIRARYKQSYIYS